MRRMMLSLFLLLVILVLGSGTVCDNYIRCLDACPTGQGAEECAWTCWELFVAVMMDPLLR